jgi:hypothetical protein
MTTVSSRLGPIIVLQPGASGASNGVAIDITDAASAAVEVSGTFTGLTVNFEGSIDNGATWYIVSLIELLTMPQTRVTTTTKAGMYFLEYARPLNALRARITTLAVPTGAVVVRARAALV